MSKINRIRIMNLNYNGNAIRIDDETFDLNGESTLLSLRNGGGKTVLVQMVIGLFVNKTYRDFEDRPFKSYFTTSRPTFLVSEWVLDHGQGYFLAGMMVRKCQNAEENNNEELEMITFTGSYQSACPYDIHNLPVISENGSSRLLKGFGACKKEFENLKRSRNSDFTYYDMSSSYQRRQYFTRLKEYQINNREWESIIKKVNLKESGLSELFTNAKDEKGLIEKWLLDAVENKLNQGNNRMKEFQSLAYKLIRQYRENQSKIRRKEIIEKYFEDTEYLKKYMDEYIAAEKNLEKQKSMIAVFIQDMTAFSEKLECSIECGKQEILQFKQQLRDIGHEKLSYEIYQLEDERKEQLQKRIESEMKINQSEYARTEAEKELCRYQCAGLYAETVDFKKRLSGLQAKISLLMEEQKDSEEERRNLGGILYHYYNNRIEQFYADIEEKDRLIIEGETEKKQNEESYEKEMEAVRELSGKIGGLKTAVKSYDRIELRFQERFHADLARNIVGEYEEGALPLYEKKCQDELLEVNTEISRLSEKQFLLKKEEERLSEESERLKVKGEQCRYELERLKQDYQSMEEEKKRRRNIMKYVEVSEQDIDNKTLLLERLDRKTEELETEKESCLEKQKALAREYDNLSQGKTVELPENITEYFAKQGIDYIYGMEWLKKNGRSVAENQKLTAENPFLPYSIILNGRTLEKLESTGEEVYTSFPIPVIVRERLEEAAAVSENGLLQFGAVSFFVMFNQHLLDPEELQKLLNEKKKEIEVWRNNAAIKKEEIQEYLRYRNTVEQQTFTLALIEENRKQTELCEIRQAGLHEEYLVCSQNKKNNGKEQENVLKLLEAAMGSRQLARNRQEELSELIAAYQKYLSDRQEQLRLEKKEKEAREKAERLKEKEKKLNENLLYLRDLKKNLNTELSRQKVNLALYQAYQKEEGTEQRELDYTALEARYKAITEGISASIEDLNRDLAEETRRYEKKEKELQKRNKYGFREAEYCSVQYSDDMTEYLEEQIKNAAREENASKEENKRLENQITRLDTRLEYARKEMTEKTGYTELKAREQIVSTDFDTDLKLTNYECDKRTEEVNRLCDRLDACRNTQGAMAEYMDFEISCEVEHWSLESASREELNRYQGTLRRDLRKLTEKREEQKQITEGWLRKTSVREEYQDDFFKKGFEHLIDLANQVYDMKVQLDTITASYDSMLKKLQVDLENIEKERKNVEEIFLDYVKDIDDNMNQIDKNSSIPVRGKSIKMLRINVPGWEENRELYQMKVRDFVDTFVRWGIEASEKGQNVDELLGKIITTKKLYDDVVGIRNIEIRLYKIEAEREVQISWAEVSANSGGEGFLSAFVILSCLLSYMRRDESDLFASGEEGKVLIMDNPFAQTNAVHLLKPLMDMAKKTNTQLICLSGLGGDSIYNRFDNIYVLNVVNSNMRQGLQYIRSEHVKGTESKKIILSQFETEQLSLFT